MHTPNKRVTLPSALALGALALLCTAGAPVRQDGAGGPHTTALAAAPRFADGGGGGHTSGTKPVPDPQHEAALERAATRAHNSRTAAEPRRTLVAQGTRGKPAAASRDARRPAAPKPKATAAAVAVRTAMAQRGKPYVWGAVGPSSFDCSGLVQYAYRSAGVRLPRTTWEQIRAGRRIPTSALRPGDLVFYRNAAHVGLYIGDGRIVHAPRPGTPVRVADLRVMPVYAAVRVGA
ncbi:C40 family peptidase [Streptomyces sp. NPDC048629]|uniref:C40 family peptidase n=1 Tax=Streptomyces sp. NPDC048629 TaxID=3154824 RepID=UPI003435762A